MAEVTFEVEELVTIKARRAFRGFCVPCNAFVQMLPVEAAALLTGRSEREIFRLIEAGEIHFIEAERVFVCRESSLKQPKLLPAPAGKYLEVEPTSDLTDPHKLEESHDYHN